MSNKDFYTAHQNLVKAFTIAVSKKFPDLMVLPYTVGMFRAFDDPDRVVRAGIKGVMDLMILGPGFYLWFDAKTGKARLTKEQKAFSNRLMDINGDIVCFKLKSVEAGIEIIEKERLRLGR